LEQVGRRMGSQTPLVLKIFGDRENPNAT